jgi:hypothetical protein
MTVVKFSELSDWFVVYLFQARNLIHSRIQVDDEWQTEIIRDPAVIRAYVRARQILEEEATLADNLAPTGDVDKDKRYKKRYVGVHTRITVEST